MTQLHPVTPRDAEASPSVFMPPVVLGKIETDKHGSPVPSWSVDGAAKVFFGRSPSWFRTRMGKVEGRPDLMDIDGVILPVRRPPGDAYGHRIFGLDDIEPLARAIHAREFAAARQKYTERVGEAERQHAAGDITERVVIKRRNIYQSAMDVIDERLRRTLLVIYAVALMWDVEVSWSAIEKSLAEVHDIGRS